MARTTHNGNGHDPRHATETPDVSHIKNLDVTHEGSDVSVSGVLKFVVGLTVMTAVVFVLMWGMFRFLYAETEKEPDPGPMAMTPSERLPPDPKLQAAPGFGVKLENGERVPLEMREPQAEYRVLRDQWERQLKCENVDPSGEVKSDANVDKGCVPIDQAMQKVLEAGLPSRKQDNASTSATGYGLRLPTAASSGRMTEEAKQ
jgi:hypothetical protein